VALVQRADFVQIANEFIGDAMRQLVGL